MISLFNPSCFPQNARICPQNRPTVGNSAIHAAVPANTRTTLSKICRGPRRRRTNARCGVIRPPRQPRWRMTSTAGGSLFSSSRSRPSSLEIEEYTEGSSHAVVCRLLMLFDGEVHPPVRADPLPPRARDRVLAKIFRHAESRHERSGQSQHFISFAPPFIAKRNKMFLLVPPCARQVLSTGENVSRVGVRPHKAALKHYGMLKVVSGPHLSTQVIVGGFALIKACAGSDHKLSTTE